jgi:hypothetical protein
MQFNPGGKRIICVLDGGGGPALRIRQRRIEVRRYNVLFTRQNALGADPGRCSGPG